MAPIRVQVRIALVVAALLLVADSRASTPTLERVSFTPSSSRPGTVVRLHFSERIASFSLQQGEDQRSVRVTTVGAIAPATLACDAVSRPFDACVIHHEAGGLVIQLSLTGLLAAADVYRDARVRTDLLVYVETAGAPVVSAATSTAGSEAEAAAGEQAARLARSAAAQRIDTVVIDAGHGGKDPGTIGYRGIREKDIVLDIARRVGAYLEESADVRVVYTRSDDRFIELRERGEIALREGGKLFVSIHANSARNTRASGTETYFLGRQKSEAARAVIERENSVIDLEDDRDHYRQFDAAQLVKVRMTESSNLMQSQDLARRIQFQYRERVGREDRKVKEGPFLVLWAAGMPAVLTEIGFISNPSEARFLTSEQGRDYIASAIFRAVRDYKVAFEAGLDVAAR
jgi:N-acetylmuramoyl-L-alanine amidase